MRRVPGSSGPARLLLWLLVPRRERESFIGDLDELFRQDLRRDRPGTPGSPGRRRRSMIRELAGVIRLRFDLPNPSRKPPQSGRVSMPPNLIQDLRFSLRLMQRNPGFTAVALATMTLGVGANTAMFSLVHGVLIEPLPYPEADRIVYLRETDADRGLAPVGVSPPDFWDWQEQSRTLDQLAAFRTVSVTYTGGDRPEVLAAHEVSPDYFSILGADPTLGRSITEGDLDPNGERVVILAYGFWQRTFGASRSVLGTSLVLNDVTHTVVGVLPQSTRPVPGEADIFLPLVRDPSWLTRRSSHFLGVLGRLAQGVSLEGAQAEMASISGGLANSFPDTNTGIGVSVRFLEDVVVGSSRAQLFILMGIAGMVLLIACANLANMTLARATVRGREFAIRIAMGAGKGRVVCQLLLESTLLAAIGGAMGVVLAHVALSGFVSTWPDLLPRLQEVGISRPVLGFTGALALGSGVAFGLAPALLVVESGFGATLREGTRSIAGGISGRWIQRGLVVSQVALAVVLLIGSGLLLKSFAALRGESPGFETEGRLVFSTRLPRERYGTPESKRVYAQEATDRLQHIPGVESVAITNMVPISGANEIFPISFEGRSEEGGSGVSAILYRISSGYIRTLGIPLESGREIGPDDLPGGTPVAVVTRSFAERNYAGENPIGQRVRFGGNPVWTEIVGVVGDVQHFHLGEESLAQIYLPFQQEPTSRVNFVIKTSLPPMSLMAGIREVIGQIDPNQPLTDIRLADELISDSISLSRFRTLLMAGFGLTALMLAVVGLYGVVAFGVSTRTKEMGIRIALGAEGRSILGLVLRESLSTVGVGLAVGLGLAIGLTGVLQSFLFRVSKTDPLVFSLVPTLLLTVATLAVVVPARRGARVDPVRTLKEE